MQALIELLAGFIALIAAAALAQFGVNLDAHPKAEREIHRVHDCPPPSSSQMLATNPDSRDC